jgi:release factor glutamine methyltransferase
MSNRIIQKLRAAGIDTPELDARLLREKAAGDDALLEASVARRVAREPMAQILGEKGFWTLDLKVTRDVLMPRPDTETVIESLLKHQPDKNATLRILDLGTGSGCLLLSALSEYPNATGVGVDASASALAVAQENTRRCGMETRTEFFLGSWCDALPEGMRFDVILSNPPYIPTREIATLMPEVRDYEPHLALDGGEDGLNCYRTLAMQIQTRMVSEAIALFEIGAHQENDVANILKGSGYAVIDQACDLSGVVRVVTCRRG